MKVSIIIPIYNISSYAPACIDSVIAQTYTNIEIILVDDGSTDSCPKICDSYIQKDNRIKVIHRPNGGLSAARNSGIEVAKGEYIYFVDGDDLVHPKCIERLVNCLEKNCADIAVCATQAFLDEKKIDYAILDKGADVYKGKQMCRRLMFGIDGSDDLVAWNKLYKRSLFDSIRYPEGMVYEDIATTHRLYWLADKVVFLRDELAFYRSKRTGSITHSGNKRYRDSIKASRMRIDFFRQKGEIDLAWQGEYLLCNDYARFIHEKVNSEDIINLKIEQKELNKNVMRGNISIIKKILSFMATYIPFIWNLLDKIKIFLSILVSWKIQSFEIFLKKTEF